MCGQKVTKKPLKKLRFLRIFLHYGGFCLRYDLFDPFSHGCLGPMVVTSPPPLPGPSVFFVGFASWKHASLWTTGPPARCRRHCPPYCAGSDVLIRYPFQTTSSHTHTGRDAASGVPSWPLRRQKQKVPFRAPDIACYKKITRNDIFIRKILCYSTVINLQKG